MIAAIVICEGAGIIGSIFTTPKIGTWYAALTKPPLAPPNWLFGPVWITLFLLMGIALSLIWAQDLRKISVRVALAVFAIQLVFNVLWSAVFFGLQSPRLAFYEIVLLWLLIGVNISTFYRVRKAAGLLLIPYWLWVSFAAILNYLVWQLN